MRAGKAKRIVVPFSCDSASCLTDVGKPDLTALLMPSSLVNAGVK